MESEPSPQGSARSDGSDGSDGSDDEGYNESKEGDPVSWVIDADGERVPRQRDSDDQMGNDDFGNDGSSPQSKTYTSVTSPTLTI